MSSEEIGIEEARKVLGLIANRAEYAGQVTYLTRNGRRVAAVVPLDRIKETLVDVVTLYETNSDVLVVARGDQAWSFGAPSGDYLNGTFTQDAQAWVDGDWEPGESNGQTPTHIDDDLTAVAEWSLKGGIRLLVDPDRIGGAAMTYLGDWEPDQPDHNGPNWGIR